VCLDQFLYLPSHIPRTPCHNNSRTLQRLNLLLRSPAAPGDNGTDMAHSLTGRGAYPYHVTHHRLGHMLPDVFGSLLPGSAPFEYLLETDQDADAVSLAIYLYDWT